MLLKKNHRLRGTDWAGPFYVIGNVLSAGRNGLSMNAVADKCAQVSSVSLLPEHMRLYRRVLFPDPSPSFARFSVSVRRSAAG